MRPFFPLILIVVAAVWSARAADWIAQSFPPIVHGSVSTLACDSAGNMYMTGQAGGTIDFNPDVGADVKVGVGSVDVYVTRINANGTYGWTQLFGGTDVDSGEAIAVTDSAVYVTGRFESGDAGFGATGTAASHGKSDTFIIALDSATGAPLAGFGDGGCQTFGGSDDDFGWGIAAAGSAVYVTGSSLSKDARIGSTSVTFSADDYTECFIIALNASTGMPLSTFGSNGIQKFAGTTGGERGDAITTHGPNVYVLGLFSSDSAGVPGAPKINNTGLGDCFVLALNGITGQPVPGFGTGGAQRFGGTDTEFAEAITVTPTAIYITGRLYSLDAGIDGTGNIASRGLSDCFVAALHRDSGAALATFGIGGALSFGGTLYEQGFSLAVSGNNLYVGGVISSRLAGFNGPGLYSANGDSDGFVMALDAVTGAAIDTFGTDGLQIFGGASSESCYCVAAFGSEVRAGGGGFGNDIMVGGAGPFVLNTYFAGLLLQLNKVNGSLIPPNVKPAAADLSLSALGIAPASGQLLATDPENDDLTYSIVADPAKGTVSIDADTGAFTYTSDQNISGSDSFTYTANDGRRNSNTATVTVTLTKNQAPTASNLNLPAFGKTPKTGVLQVTDLENDTLTYSIVASPTLGTVDLNSATGAFTYVSANNTAGSDSFTFMASDGTQDSNVGTVSIAITVNTAPAAVNFSVQASGRKPLIKPLQTTDEEGDALTFSIVLNPASGTLTLNPGTGEFTYVANANSAGSDSFDFRCNDGQQDSNAATVSITIVINAPPVAQDGTVAAAGTAPASGQLNATDPENDTLTYALVSNPARGSVTLNAATGAFTYMSTANVTATDSFTFTASDGQQLSNAGTVTINITHVNEAPVLISGPTATPDHIYAGESVVLSVNATDPEGEALTANWDFKDASFGAGATVSHKYPVAGTYQIVVTVSDGQLSTSAMVPVVVTAAKNAAISKGAVKFTFGSANRDSLTLAGTIALQNGFVLNGQMFNMRIVDYTKSNLQFDAANTAAEGKQVVFKIQAKADKKTGAITVPPLPKYTLSLTSLTLYDALKSAGFVNDDVKSKAVPISTSFTIGGAPFVGTKTFIYSAKKDKSGSGK